MRPERVGAHDAPMFNDYWTTRALIDDRQGALRHEARQHRLVRITRRGRRAPGEVRGLRPAVPPLPADPLTAHRDAA